VAAEGEKWRGGANHDKEMLKMKEPPGMCMKTKQGMTKCPVKNRAFPRKMQQLRDDRQGSVGLMDRECMSYAIIQGKMNLAFRAAMGR
jgi:hypothetical protein